MAKVIIHKLITVVHKLVIRIG